MPEARYTVYGSGPSMNRNLEVDAPVSDDGLAAREIVTAMAILGLALALVLLLQAL